MRQLPDYRHSESSLAISLISLPFIGIWASWWSVGFEEMSIWRSCMLAVIAFLFTVCGMQAKDKYVLEAQNYFGLALHAALTFVIHALAGTLAAWVALGELEWRDELPIAGLVWAFVVPVSVVGSRRVLGTRVN